MGQRRCRGSGIQPSSPLTLAAEPKPDNLPLESAKFHECHIVTTNCDNQALSLFYLKAPFDKPKRTGGVTKVNVPLSPPRLGVFAVV